MDWRQKLVERHAEEYGVPAQMPESDDFRDGTAAEGCWWEPALKVVIVQVAGLSGVYHIHLSGGRILRDDRPWQMTV